MRRAYLTLLVLGIISVAPASAWAAPEDVANAVSNEIMSPYCPGVTLHDCPSDTAEALRERITEWAEMGWSKDRIIDKLSSPEEFGPGILASPPRTGAGLAAWVLPIGALIAGALLIWMLLRRWTDTPPEAPPAVSDDDHRRVEAEMSKMRTAE